MGKRARGAWLSFAAGELTWRTFIIANWRYPAALERSTRPALTWSSWGGSWHLLCAAGPCRWRPSCHARASASRHVSCRGSCALTARCGARGCTRPCPALPLPRLARPAGVRGGQLLSGASGQGSHLLGREVEKQTEENPTPNPRDTPELISGSGRAPLCGECCCGMSPGAQRLQGQAPTATGSHRPHTVHGQPLHWAEASSPASGQCTSGLGSVVVAAMEGPTGGMGWDVLMGYGSDTKSNPCLTLWGPTSAKA